MNLISAAVNLVLSLPTLSNFHSHMKMLVKLEYYKFLVVCFWTFDNLKIILMRSVIFKMSEILTSISFFLLMIGCI
jgi:hypothetical protein